MSNNKSVMGFRPVWSLEWWFGVSMHLVCTALVLACLGLPVEAESCLVWGSHLATVDLSGPGVTQILRFNNFHSKARPNNKPLSWPGDAALWNVRMRAPAC